ncbi:proline-rich protein 2-like [Aquila chrysaetos chrysaetos]|uniref:proline-rich protein 2-like n=1 Tax=Aquila chrysaetos chrysaetos TaxID=223781 RepID=UPI0011771602|nr:proline-rich protein 2-like [Aquila chrysaetos chrysaetos]
MSPASPSTRLGNRPNRLLSPRPWQAGGEARARVAEANSSRGGWTPAPAPGPRPTQPSIAPPALPTALRPHSGPLSSTEGPSALHSHRHPSPHSPPSQRLTAGRAAPAPSRFLTARRPRPAARRGYKRGTRQGAPDGKRRPQGGRRPAAPPRPQTAPSRVRQRRHPPRAGPNGGLTAAAFGSAPPPIPGRRQRRAQLLSPPPPPPPPLQRRRRLPGSQGAGRADNVCARPGPRHREAETAAAGTAPPSAPLPRRRSPAVSLRPLLASFSLCLPPRFVRPGAAREGCPPPPGRGGRSGYPRLSV